MWLPRLIQKIKSEGKLIEMADKKYVTGDKYEAIINGEKVKLESNPVNGGHTIRMASSWICFGDDMERLLYLKKENGFHQRKQETKELKLNLNLNLCNLTNRGLLIVRILTNFDWVMNLMKY